MTKYLENLKQKIGQAWQDDNDADAQDASTDGKRKHRFDVLMESYRSTSKQVRNSITMQLLIIFLLFAAAARNANAGSEPSEAMIPLLGMTLPILPFRIACSGILLFYWARLGYILDASVKARLRLLSLDILDRHTMAALRDHFFIDGYILLFYPWSINPTMRWYSPARLLAIISFIVLIGVVLGLNNFLFFATVWGSVMPISNTFGGLFLVAGAVVMFLTYTGFGISQYSEGERFFVLKYIVVLAGIASFIVSATIASVQFGLNF
jgi:hypothetical protein